MIVTLVASELLMKNCHSSSSVLIGWVVSPPCSLMLEALRPQLLKCVQTEFTSSATVV